MNGKTIMLGLLIIGISLVWDSFGLSYNYAVALAGTSVVVLGLLSKNKVA